MSFWNKWITIIKVNSIIVVMIIISIIIISIIIIIITSIITIIMITLKSIWEEWRPSALERGAAPHIHILRTLVYCILYIHVYCMLYIHVYKYTYIHIQLYWSLTRMYMTLDIGRTTVDSTGFITHCTASPVRVPRCVRNCPCSQLLYLPTKTV